MRSSSALDLNTFPYILQARLWGMQIVSSSLWKMDILLIVAGNHPLTHAQWRHILHLTCPCGYPTLPRAYGRSTLLSTPHPSNSKGLNQHPVSRLVSMLHSVPLTHPAQSKESHSVHFTVIHQLQHLQQLLTYSTRPWTPHKAQLHDSRLISPAPPL